MSVTCFFFSPNKLIDYFPALWSIRVHVSARCLRPSVKQTRNLRPTSMSFIEKATIISSKLDHDSAQRRTKREDLLRLALRTYCRFTRRIRSIPLSLRSERYSLNMPLRPSSFPRSSVSRCRVSTNTGTTACLHCSYLSWSNAQLCGSECVRSRSSIQCRLSRVRCNHDGKRVKVQTDEPLPGDVVSLGECLDSLKGVLY